MARLELTADQVAYDAWYATLLARAEDPQDDFHMADLMDMNNVFATARTLAVRHPECAGALMKWTPEALERAGGELGTFMGVSWLAERVGLDPHEARDVVVELMRGAV
jgi:hypothetical protein